MAGEIKSHQEYRALRGKYFASKGVQQYNAFLANNVAYYVFDENYRELKKCIEEHFQLSMHGQLWRVDKREELHEHITEATRRLHNFLSAAKTLVDNTRYFVKNTFGTQSRALIEYQIMVKEVFHNVPICCFTQELRNNLTHVCVPFVSSVMGGSKATGRDLFTLQLRSKKFSKSWRWSTPAQQYIDSVNGDIDLELFAKEYWDIVRNFYRIFSHQIKSWAGVDWEEMLAMHHKLVAYETERELRRSAAPAAPGSPTVEQPQS
jgi:hypothetical protein